MSNKLSKNGTVPQKYTDKNATECKMIAKWSKWCENREWEIWLGFRQRFSIATKATNNSSRRKITRDGNRGLQRKIARLPKWPLGNGDGNREVGKGIGKRGGGK